MRISPSYRSLKFVFIWIFWVVGTYSIYAQRIERAEYFVDQDPGLGLADSIPISTTLDSLTGDFELDIDGLSAGLHKLFIRTKDTSGFWSPWTMRIFQVDDTITHNQIDRVEYFIDNDNGIGKSTNVTISPSDSISPSFSQSLASLNLGNHFVHVRQKMRNGLWSPWQIHLFSVEDTINAGPINQMEYFIDKEKGFGSSTNISITLNDSISANFSQSLASFSLGNHFVHVRQKISTGLWSPWQLHLFRIEDTLNTGPIDHAEYFIDKDKGFGKSTTISISPNDSISADFTQSLSSLALGNHFLHVRQKISTGLWSPWQLHLFRIEDTLNSGPIDQMEYFIDKDKGFGNSTAISISPNDSVSTSFDQNLASLSLGNHFLHVRQKISTGLWSPWQLHLFRIEDTLNSGPIDQMEYFIDKDKGVGNSTPISITPNDTVNTTFNHSLAGLSVGNHHVHVRQKISTGIWSPWQFHLFRITDTTNSDHITAINYTIDSSLIHSQYVDTLSLTPSTDSFNFVHQPKLDTSLTYGQHFYRAWALQNNRLRSTWHKDTFVVIDCPMLDTAAITISGKYCHGDTQTLVQNITPLGIWPIDSFNFSWTSNGSIASTTDSLRLIATSKDTFDVVFSFQRKSDKRCKGELQTQVVFENNLRDTTHYAICQGDSVQIHGIYRKTAGTFTKNLNSKKGCDSVSVAIITIAPSYRDTTQMGVCQGDSVRIHGTFRQIAGTYIFNGKTSNGCDSIVTSVLKVYQHSKQLDTATICNGDTLKIHGKKYNIAGTYIDSFKTVFGCDSIFETTLNVNPSSYDSSTIIVCQGDGSVIHGTYRTTANIYTFKGTKSNGCDSISVRRLIVYPTYNDTVKRTICQGDSAFIHGAFQKKSGSYVFKGNTALSCDSVVTTVLTVNPVYRKSDTLSICQGDTLKIHGKQYYTSGVYLDSFKTTQGCDSFFETKLIVNPIFRDSLDIVICNGDSSLIHGVYRKTSNIYTFKGKSSKGCDSTSIRKLIVNPTYQISNQIAVCQGDSLLIHGKFRNTSGTYVFKGSTVLGCDSSVTTVFTVNPVYHKTDTISICQGDTLKIHGKLYRTAGTYLDSFKTKNGCDSLFETKLNVNPVFRDSASIVICNGDSTLIHGVYRKTANTFTFKGKSIKGCDSTSIRKLIVNPTYNVALQSTICQGDSILIHGKFQKTSGNYVLNGSTTLGCDSVVNIFLTVNPTYHKTDTFSICNGDTLKKHGNEYISAGNYDDAFKTTLNCDSSFTTTLRVLPTYNLTQNKGLCGGDSFVFDGITRKITGSYIGFFKTNRGCDSTVTLKLTVDTVIRIPDLVKICAGDSLFIGGAYRKTAGVYVENLKAQKGCDSIVDKTLVIIPRDSTKLQLIKCRADVVSFHGQQIVNGGVYFAVLKNQLGCDSILRLTVTIRPKNEVVKSGTVCFGDSAFVGNSFKKGSGIFRDTLVDRFSCDSIVIYTQIERPLDSSSISVSICAGDSVFTGNSFKSKAGDFVDVLKNQHNCDSLVHTKVLVKSTSRSQFSDTFCFNDTYSFFGKALISPGVYEHKEVNSLGCDSVIELTLIRRAQFIPKIVSPGFAQLTTVEAYETYQWFRNREILINDTNAVYIIKSDGAYDVTVSNVFGCFANSWDDLSGLYDVATEQITVFPNPAYGHLNIFTTENGYFVIYNATGAILKEQDVAAGGDRVDISDFPDGVFYVVIFSNNRLLTRKIIKLH